MTRKDYITIAAALRISLDRAKLTSQEAREAVYDAATELACALRFDNTRFDTDHFLAVVNGQKDLYSRPSRNGRTA